MKICYICNELNLRSGWAVLNYHTVQQAILAGHEVTVFTAKGAQNIPLKGQVTIHPLLYDFGKGLSLKDILNFFSLLKILNKTKFDLAHVLVEPYLLYNFLNFGGRSYLTAVGTYSVSLFKKSKLRFLYNLSLQKISAVFAISDYTRLRFEQATGFSKAFTAGLGVDFNHFNKPVSLKDKKMKFCLVGQMKKRKGILPAIQAVEILKKQFPSLTLSLVGDDRGAYAQTCRDYVNSHDLKANVIFHGKLSDQELLNIYAESIGNLLPSINTSDGSFEGFGLIHLEANAMGLPSIGSRETGNETAIAEGDSGYLARQNDPADLASKMQEILDHFQRGTYSSLSDSCVKFARAKSWEIYFQKLSEQYTAFH
jgi:glycosyltransferase involved in cell wall biosynthesis